MNAKNIQVQDFVWTYVFISPEYIPKSGIAGSLSLLEASIFCHEQFDFNTLEGTEVDNLGCESPNPWC